MKRCVECGRPAVVLSTKRRTRRQRRGAAMDGHDLCSRHWRALRSRAYAAKQKGEQKMQCPIKYDGQTFPQFRGARCELEEGHDGRRHEARVHADYTAPLQWWTPAEKEAIRARKRARAAQEDES